MPSPQDIIANLTKLSSTEGAPQVDDGVIALFEHPKWDSARYDINVRDYAKVKRNTVDLHFVDKAMGTVATLTDKHRPDNYGIGDLNDVGPSVDLVGTGTTESADFRLCGFIDKLYSFFWREVDLTYGALEMFEHPDFTGNRMKLFLSEWSPEMNHDLSGWHLATSVSSLKGTSLLERQSVTLTRSPGDKDGFNQVMGWSGNKEITNMANTGYDNSISCWSWPPLNPIKETITPIKFSGSGSEVKDVSLTQSYENHTDTEQTQEFTFKQTITDTFTVSTNVMHVVAITVKATVGVEATVPLVGTAKNEYSLEVAYNYTNSKTETTTHTDTMEIGERYMTICAPQGLTEVKLFASVGKLPEAVYTTKAKRWYTQELDGTVKDAVGYWREEDTQVTISGGVLIKSDVKVYFNAFGKGGGK